ncbi:MAG: MDR family oxidoreductase [Alphaproteobacteria bacterium]
MGGDTFRALVLREIDGRVSAKIETLPLNQLPPGEILINTRYSTLNYKDGMILNGIGRLVNKYPHIPGIDLSGIVAESQHPDFKVGDEVLITGYRFGEIHWGGYAEKARVPADWVVPLPKGISLRDAMAIGTAGFTAMQAIIALEDHGLSPERGEVLVTGAVGGVGSIAVAVLGKLGYRVIASTGRPDEAGWLKSLGATDIVARESLATASEKPLEAARWAGAIDSVGGSTLGRILGQMKSGGGIAACGLAGGQSFTASVLPFLLRGVNLLGIDSVMVPTKHRRTIWQRLARDLPLDKLRSTITMVDLPALPNLAKAILKGQVKGRTVVDVTQT